MADRFLIMPLKADATPLAQMRSTGSKRLFCSSFPKDVFSED
jgi:hypothetical protein